MATTTTSSLSAIACEDKRPVDEAFLNKLKNLVERLRDDNSILKQALDTERSGIRALKAQNDAEIRTLKSEHKKREENLEKQLRSRTCASNEQNRCAPDLKKLSMELQSLKADNKCLLDKLKISQLAESARAADLRAQAACHTASEQVQKKEARSQCHKLLEEIKSKERVIIQLQRELSRVAPKDNEKIIRMDTKTSDHRKIRVDLVRNKKINTTKIERDVTSYKEANCSDEESGVSSAPQSLSPQSLPDMWSCNQCRASEARASAASRECARLTDALRDARDQLELMEFRLLELEDTGADKGPTDNLTDSDSGCVSPGSRIKDSASPELKRMDSGYKSPNAPSSPCNRRRNYSNNEDFKDDFAKAQVLADILDRTSETSDSLRSNPVKDHLEQMILNAGSVEDRNCLEQVLMMLYNYQALSSSVSEDDFHIKPKRLVESKTQKSTNPFSKDRVDSIDHITEDRKPLSVLQESGIFEEIEVSNKETQTEVAETENCELYTEIQRLNSIREKLEKQGVRNRTLDSEGLECKCVKLGKKHRQYYERRLKFLEGKISIYEAAQDVKQAKLAERLQKEFVLENKVQELESQLLDLQDKYERLEEECCELEEIENDTRLHWQQLEMDYELCSAQLRDTRSQHECSQAQAERVIAELSKKEIQLKSKERDLRLRLEQLEKAVPALIAWNMVKVVGVTISPGGQRALLHRIGPFNNSTKEIIAKCKEQSKKDCDALNSINNIMYGESPTVEGMQNKITCLLTEKDRIEKQAAKLRESLSSKITDLESQLVTLSRQSAAAERGSQMKTQALEEKIEELENKIKEFKLRESAPLDHITSGKLRALLLSEQDLKLKVAEMEKREKAYLEMLTQADDMWAEMEGGYKKKISDFEDMECSLRGKVSKLEDERDQWRKCFEPLKKKLKEIEESESYLKIELDKKERDAYKMKEMNLKMNERLKKAEEEAKKAEIELKNLETKFKKEQDQLRQLHKSTEKELKTHKEQTKKAEQNAKDDFASMRKEMMRLCKTNQDMETTCSELKEEVESLEKQLSITQKALSQCKRRCDEKIKTLSHELSIKTEELEEIRSEAMRQIRNPRVDIKPDRTEYIDEGYTICSAVPKKIEYPRMHHSLNYISEARCSCPAMRSHLVGQLIEDLFERLDNCVDEDLKRVCKEIASKDAGDTKAIVMNYLLLAISKELVRSIGDADAKTETEEWRRAVSLSASASAGNAGVVRGAERLASLSCACAAARLTRAMPQLAELVKPSQQEVLEHSDVKIMEEQLANAIESIVNCPSCALGTNAIVWSTDV